MSSASNTLIHSNNNTLSSSINSNKEFNKNNNNNNNKKLPIIERKIINKCNSSNKLVAKNTITPKRKSNSENHKLTLKVNTKKKKILKV